MEKLEEIKIKEGDKFIKEKDAEIKQIKKDMNKSMSKLRKKFKLHQNHVKHLYESKVNALHDKYKSLFEKEIMKLTFNNKTVTVDQEIQSEQSVYKNQFTETCNDEVESEYSNVPEKETCAIKKSDDRQYNEKKDEGDVNELLINVTQDNDVSKLKINRKLITEEKHKIETIIEEKSVVSHNIDIIPMQDVIVKSKANYSSSAPGSEAILLQRISDLEHLLFLKTHETKRNAKLYDKKIRQEQMKSRELITLLDQEMSHSSDIQCRLGMEYNRAEQLLLEKEGMKDKYTQLEIRLQETEQTLENEKAKAAALMQEIEKLTTQGEHSDQLELSLMRLRHKLDQALECEQRLTLELKKEMQNNKKIEALLRLNEITETYSDKPKGYSPRTKVYSGLLSHRCHLFMKFDTK
ncbi:hypothetical protein O3M35_006289 [Rhynocoris fuscipes]|uniref:Uncharacterized protein n=1 Tax=Rhynocoris fuscipes TaxID=488301 RepID=A0AAW1DIR3_9HEMI